MALEIQNQEFSCPKSLFFTLSLAKRDKETKKSPILADQDSTAGAAEVLASQIKRVEEEKLQTWEELGHKFEAGELDELKTSIADMALSRIDGQDELYVGGIWALRRSESLSKRGITHVLSMVAFNPANLKNFNNEPWTDYGKEIKQLVIDLDDVDDENLLLELPRAVRFINQSLRGTPAEPSLDSLSLEPTPPKNDQQKPGAVFVHCAAGKSRSVSAVVAYLLWRYPNRFDPSYISPSVPNPSKDQSAVQRPRRETAAEAVEAAVSYIRRTRPMAEPNDGFMKQLQLWWEMGCPVEKDIEQHPIYQRWVYQREVAEHLAVNQAPSRLRFEDEHTTASSSSTSGLTLRCKKCSRTLATAAYISPHENPKAAAGGGDSDPASTTTTTTTAAVASAAAAAAPCQHFFIEPLSWMRGELEKGALNGRLLCPTARCGAAVGRYDWKGYRCSCGAWVCPAFSLQRARVDDVVRPGVAVVDDVATRRSLGIRMPPGKGNL